MTQAKLKRLFDYDPETGIFVRKTNQAKCVKAWSIAGSKHGGYLRININNKRYFLHNLAWLYIHGRWPNPQVDHINGVRDDNRIANLREATPSQNQRNRKKGRNGLKGAYARDYGWVASIHPGQPIYLGWFKTEHEAHNAYCAAAKQHFGEYARTS